MGMRLKTYMIVGLLLIITVLIAGFYHEIVANTTVIDHQQITMPVPLPILTPPSSGLAPAQNEQRPPDLNALPNPSPSPYPSPHDQRQPLQGVP